MIDKGLITKFIEIGKKEDFAALETLFSPEEVKRKGDIMRHSFQAQYDIADSLTEEEVAALIKVFTIAEKMLKEWVAWIRLKTGQPACRQAGTGPA